MNSNQFRTALDVLGITQANLAELLNTTRRGVNLWATEGRDVPGPVAAYLNLLLSLPRALQVQEFSRLKGKDTLMEGLYSFSFTGAAGGGLGALILMGGRVFGSDGGVKYDGSYVPNGTRPGHVDLALKLTVAPGVALVQGVPAQPAEYRFDIALTVPARGEGLVVAQTPYGSVNVFVRFLREVPRELAA